MKLDIGSITAVTAIVSTVVAVVVNAETATRRARQKRDLTRFVTLRKDIPDELQALRTDVDVEIERLRVAVFRPFMNRTLWALVGVAMAAGIIDAVVLVIWGHRHPDEADRWTLAGVPPGILACLIALGPLIFGSLGLAWVAESRSWRFQRTNGKPES